MPKLFQRNAQKRPLWTGVRLVESQAVCLIHNGKQLSLINSFISDLRSVLLGGSMKNRKRILAKFLCISAFLAVLHIAGVLQRVNAAFPGLNGKIAFQSNRDGNYEIYVMDPDGANQTRLTYSPGEDYDAAWSPDGRKIAFSSRRDGDFEIYVMNADGSGLTALTDNTSDDIEPAWSPDGTMIAFVSGRDGDNEVYVMNADGAGPVRLTFAPGYEFAPDWSPDSTKIVFSSSRDFDHEIYVMDANGANQTRLTFTPDFDLEPSWSPHGAKIAFSSWRNGNSEIFVMNADGTEQARLTFGDGRYAAWSPDGTKIAFSKWSDTGYGIHVMDAEGSNLIRLTTSTSIDYWADWQPISPDSDGDGIPDDMDVEGIQDAVAGLPNDAFKGGYPGHAGAITSVLDDVEFLIATGNYAEAVTKLLNLSRRVDGCGVVADQNDWIIDCAAQTEIRELIDDLIENLSL